MGGKKPNIQRYEAPIFKLHFNKGGCSFHVYMSSFFFTLRLKFLVLTKLNKARSKETGNNFCKKHTFLILIQHEMENGFKNVHFNYQGWNIKNSDINLKKQHILNFPHKLISALYCYDAALITKKLQYSMSIRLQYTPECKGVNMITMERTWALQSGGDWKINHPSLDLLNDINWRKSTA